MSEAEEFKPKVRDKLLGLVSKTDNNRFMINNFEKRLEIVDKRLDTHWDMIEMDEEIKELRKKSDCYNLKLQGIG